MHSTRIVANPESVSAARPGAAIRGSYASGSVHIGGSRFSRTRVGMTRLSDRATAGAGRGRLRADRSDVSGVDGAR